MPTAQVPAHRAAWRSRPAVMADSGIGDEIPQSPRPEMTPNDVLRAMGRELETQTAVLKAIRGYLGFMVLVIVIQIIIAVLIVGGAITLDVKTSSSF